MKKLINFGLQSMIWVSLIPRWSNAKSYPPELSSKYPILFEHEPESFTPSRSNLIPGTDYTIPASSVSPDFRVPEPPRLALYPKKEFDRPIKLSPYNIIPMVWRQVACACITVFKRFTPLAGCAVITTRHILTTASSIELILKGREHYTTFKDVYGAWYETTAYGNSSLYTTPSRIHYHPKFISPYQVNASHPVPCVYDLAVWASEYRFYWSLTSSTNICNRGGPRMNYPPRPLPNEQMFVIGWQFIRALRRKPSIWYKYGVRTRKHVYPCPKTEWGGFNCVGGQFASLGMDNGGTQFRYDYWDAQQSGRVYDGLIGLNSFSMKLRSKQMVHYYTTLNTHEVLDFLYDAYMGRFPYMWLDSRFEDVKGAAPVPRPYVHIPFIYEFGKEWEKYQGSYVDS